jgi:PAS domain S-box-containing protein
MYNSAQPVRILIIDDDEDDYILTSSLIKEIEDREFDIHWCYNYKNALDIISKGEFDLYFVDYRLGAKTGIDLLREACQIGSCEEPIILLTGKGNSQIDKEAMELGAVDYLVKSDLTTEKLERCIRYSLERSATMKALKANERKYRNIFEKSKEAVFTTDENLVFRDINQAMTNLLDREKNDLLEMNLYQLIEGESAQRVIREQLALEGEVNDLEVEIFTSKGKKRNCILFLSIEKDSSDHSVQGILHDITNQKKTERATLLAEKLAATGRLVRTLAHEVRNPLSNIHMSLEQLGTATKNEDKIYLDIIERNGRRINDLITELLTSSRPTELNFNKISLQAVIDDAITAALDRITLKQIKLKVSYPEFTCEIKGDREKLKIAFLNIIINAIEAISHNNGELSVYLLPVEENFAVEVTDNGVGIPPENLSKLFEPYFTSKRNGIGLGLASTLNILQSHNATVEVKSKVGSGTTFIVTFSRAV